MNPRVIELIERLQLQPHPEGGYFRETFRSEMQVDSPLGVGRRSAVTDIYFLLAEGQVSRLHRVVHEELWHFYEGDPLELIEVDEQSLDLARITLGAGNYKHCVKAGNWQAARSTGAYTLVGCTVAPGFDFADFSFLADDEGAAELRTVLTADYADIANCYL